MSVWFTRCNGETGHNQPGTARCMEGEPPNWPMRSFNYVNECLRDGFARVGWPAAGDLCDSRWKLRAANAYGNLMKPHHVRFLEQFAQILPGDVILIPTYQRRYEVHLGVATPPRRRERADSAGGAYYYYFDTSGGDWFENAHRVDVQWAKRSDGAALAFHIPEIGGTWVRSFGQVRSGAQRIVALARNGGL